MIYLFDKDEKLIKIIRKPAIKTALQKYSLTKERYVSDRLTVEMKALNDDELEKVEYMAIQTMEDAHKFHYFYVAQKSSENLTTLIGVQSGIEELRKSPVFDKRPQNAFAREVINDLLSGTNWSARFVGETTPHSTNFYYISVFDALKKVCEVWDLEMQFFVEMNGNKIGARYIDFKRKIGQAVGKRVVYGHNALQILQEVERTNIFTALIGRGKGEQVSSAEESGKQANGFGRKITFEDVVWSTASGKPVNKPKGQKYVELPAMTKLYGIKNADGSMRPKIGFVDFSEEENPEILIERTYTALVDSARPQLTLKTSSVYLRGAKVGDTIRVVRHDKKLDYDTRIFEITFNRLNDQSSDIKLGDRIGESNEAKAQTIADKAIDEFVANEFTNFVKNLPDYLPTVDGFNNNWYGVEDPTGKHPGKVLINDIWYKPDPEHEGHKIMLRWTGEVWEELLRTFSSEALRAKISGEIEKLDKAMKASDLALKEQTTQALRAASANTSAIEAAKGAITKLNQDLAGAKQTNQAVIDRLKSDFASAQKAANDQTALLRNDLGAIRNQQTVYEQSNTQNLARITGQLDNKASKTEVKQTADGIREELASLSVGGRNLIGTFNTHCVKSIFDIDTYRFSGKTEKNTNTTSLQLQFMWDDGSYTSVVSINALGAFKKAFKIKKAYREFIVKFNSNKEDAKLICRDSTLLKLNEDYLFTGNLLNLSPNDSVADFLKIEKATIPSDWSPALEDTEGLITEAKATFERTAQGLRTDLTAVQAYVSADGTRVEALRTYSREETARQLTAERKLIESGYVAKAQHTEDVQSISRRFEELKTSSETKLAEYRQTVDGQLASVQAALNTANSSLTNFNSWKQSAQETLNKVGKVESGLNETKTSLAEFKRSAEGQLTTISQQVAGKASQTEFQRVQETSKLYERLIGSTEKEIADKVTRMALTNELFQTEVSKNRGLRTVQSQLAGSWSIKNLNSASDILGQLNLNPDGSVSINEGLISIGDKTHIKNGVIKNAMIESMLADKITAGTLNAANVNIVNLNANKIVGLDANFIKSKIELAFIEWMKGKTISAQNDAMQINLNDGHVLFYNDDASIKRVLEGYPTQFIRYENKQENGQNHGRTIIGSNRNGTNRWKSASFAGFVIDNNSNNSVDKIYQFGDYNHMRHAQSDDGWNFSVVTQAMTPGVWNKNSEIWARHFVVPRNAKGDTDSPTQFIRLEESVAAIWNILTHAASGQVTMTQAMKNLINSRKAAWDIVRNVG